MKAIKTLLAISALAAVSAANATTIATFTYDDSWTTYKQLINGNPSTATYGTGNLSGSGTLDDSGVLTITATSYFMATGSSTHQYNATDTTTFTGTITGGTFNITSTSNIVNSCNDPSGGTGCAQVVSGGPTAFTAAVAVSGQTQWTTPKTKVGANPAWNQDTYTFKGTPVSSVPVPAAAWLFGSGLLGLAGTARRRSQQSA